MTENRVPWRLNDVVLAFILGILVIGVAAALVPLLTPQAPRAGAVIGMTVGYLLLGVVVWYFAIYKRKGSWSELGFRRFNVAWGILVAVIWFAVLRLLTTGYAFAAERLGFEPPDDAAQRVVELFGRDTLGIILAIMLTVIVAPVIEELFFRGFIYLPLRRRLGVTSAIFVNGVLFAVVHFNQWLFIPIAFIGFALAYLYERTKSLGPPIILHAINNFISVVVLYLSVLRWGF